ncbi:MAG: RluA family pseudouridine synthase [Clostridia bacterium]|nr:RluA family pseudouridine synthase [Clostridia bacterium]
MTVEQVLRRQGGFTKKQISQAKYRPNGIMKNGAQCRVTEKVDQGDEISICLETREDSSAHITGMEGSIDILYEDKDVLAVNKPSGMVTHPIGRHYQDTLVNLTAGYYEKKGENVRIRPIGRLDKETSGFVIFAKNQTAAARLQKQREKKAFRKVYLAVVQGCLEKDGKEHMIKLPIIPDPEHPLKMCAGDQADGKSAVTHYTVLDSQPEYSLVKLWLETGRTHQIRVHMKNIGHPLLGDSLYNENNDENPMILRAALHAWKTYFQQPFSDQMIETEAPVPEDMAKLYSSSLISFQSLL